MKEEQLIDFEIETLCLFNMVSEFMHETQMDIQSKIGIRSKKGTILILEMSRWLEGPDGR